MEASGKAAFIHAKLDSHHVERSRSTEMAGEYVHIHGH